MRQLLTTICLLLATTCAARAAASTGEFLAYDGVANSAVATNALRVTGVTNVAVKGNATMHSVTATNLTASVPVETDSAKKLVSGTVTGTGAFVKDTAPTIASLTVTTALTVPDNTIALGIKTTGNYAAGDAEAGNASTVVVVDSTDATSFPLIADSATGGNAVKTDGALLYNASSGALTATSFVGAGGGLTLTASGFNGNLTTADDTLQEVAQKVDDLNISGGAQTPWGSDINAATFSLTNVTSVVGTGSGTTTIENTGGLNITNTPVTIEDPVTMLGTLAVGGVLTQTGNIELNHASANTLSASSGQLSVEGNAVFTAAITKADVLEAALFAADAGANDTYVATLSPAITAYVTGAHYRFKANTANTGAATVNFNGLGAKTIKKAAGGITTDLADNDIRAGQWCDLVYDGTNMQLQSGLGNAAAGSGTVTSVGWTGGIVSIATATTTPAFTIAGTSGGIPYFSGSTTWASSAALAANAIVIGGGAGVAPSTTTTGTGVLTGIGNTVNATGGFLTTDGTASPTGKTYDAAATGNVLKQTKQLNLQRPDYGDGVGAVPQTNTFNVSGLMHYTFSGNAETNANWAVYEFDCPSDLDTTVEMTARFSFLSGIPSGTDADNYVFHITYAQNALGAAYSTGTTIATSPIVMTCTPTTPASGDLQSTGAVTLTGWAASLSAGRAMQVRVARLQNTQDDGARDVQLVITYGSTL